MLKERWTLRTRVGYKEDLRNLAKPCQSSSTQQNHDLALSWSILVSLAQSCQEILLNLAKYWSSSFLQYFANTILLNQTWVLQVLARSSCSILHMMGLAST
jgi:hypothetical protein